jgi:hypothetical protein
MAIEPESGPAHKGPALPWMQYVCHRLLGAPPQPGHNPLWECPACGKVKLHALPPDARHRDLVYCNACTFQEDASGLMERVRPRPGVYHRHRLEELERWRAAWGRGDTAGADAEGIPSFPAGPQGPSPPPRRGAAHTPDEVALAWAGLSPADRHRLDEHAAALAFLADLAAYARGHRDFVAASDAAHRAGCADPDCEAIVCRAARGLPPLTEAERAAGAVTEARRRRAALDRFVRQLRQGGEPAPPGGAPAAPPGTARPAGAGPGNGRSGKG